MRKDIINMAAIGIFTLALTACGNAASNQPEAKAEKSLFLVHAAKFGVFLLFCKG